MLPNLVVIGAMKCGTGSLHRYLDLHSQIHMSQIKELDFFVEEKNWKLGLDWYQTNFTEPAEVLGESSTNYSKHPLFRGVPERMHRIIPDAKLIYIIRDPVERIVSQYIHNVAKGRERRTLDVALTELSENDYVNCSRYFMQIERYLAYYRRSSILVISSEGLAHCRMKVLSEVFRFLKVDPSFEHLGFSIMHHQSSRKKRNTGLGLRLRDVRGAWLLRRIWPWLLKRSIEKPVMSQSLRYRLADVLSNDVIKLREFTGCSFENWCL